MKILSIIVPSYNLEEYIERNIKSIAESRCFAEIELIIVNDGSKDRTLEIANKYREIYPDSVVVIDKINGGHGSTINVGTEIATGKYLKVIDGDDWVDTNAFDIFVDNLKQLDVDIVFSPYTKQYVDTGEKEVVELHNIQSNSIQDLPALINDIGAFYCIHSITFKGEVYKAHQRKIDENCFYVDQEYILYPLRDIKTFVYIDTNVYQYRLGRIGQSVAMTSKIKNREMHLKVINSLMQMNAEDDTCNEYKIFMVDRIVSLINIQYSIYLSMHADKDNYDLYKSFRQDVINKIPKESFYNISRIVYLFPWAYWLLARRYRKKYVEQ